MPQKTKNLSLKQHRALQSLMTSPNLSAAAIASGVSRRSLSRWLAEDAEFQSEYRKLRRDSFAQTSALLTSVSGLAVKTLVEIASDKSAPVTGRVNASLGILRLAQTGIETDSTAAEIAEINEFIEKEKQSNVRR